MGWSNCGATFTASVSRFTADVDRLLGFRRCGALRVKQIGERQLESRASILSHTAQLFEDADGPRSVTFAQAGDAAFKKRIVIERILRQDFLNACRTIIVALFCACNFHQENLVWQIVGRIASIILDQLFCFGRRAGSQQQIRIAHSYWRAWRA